MSNNAVDASEVIIMTDKQMYFSVTELKERGWTSGLISKFLSAPDATKANPYYKSAAQMKFYLKDRVQQIEVSSTFMEAKTKTENRRKSASKATQTKIDKTLKLAKEFDTDVNILSKQELVELACQHYNHRSFERNKDWHAAPDSDEIFLNRICVNYLRHDHSEYEYSLGQLYGKTGKYMAYKLVKNNTLENIATSYPWLADECKSQKVN